MSTGALEREETFPFDSIFFQDQIDSIITQILPIFKRTINQHAIFHLFYFTLGLCEALFFLFYLTELVKSSLLATSLALIFLTFFSYFVIRLYLQNKKLRQLDEIHDLFLNTCEELIGFREDLPEHRLAIATACTRCAAAFRGQEASIWKFPRWLQVFKPSVASLSSWWHWENVHALQERLLLSAVEQHLELVKMEPTNLQVHAALANAYVTLSSIYLNPHQEKSEEEKKQPHEARRHELEAKFRLAAERAIEEFKIINDFAPDDPWVHLQLAYSYRDLGMPNEVIREFETVYRISPDDDETLFQLGLLYFQQGFNANGLKVYEQLRQTHYAKAEQLILHYGGPAQVLKEN